MRQQDYKNECWGLGKEEGLKFFLWEGREKEIGGVLEFVVGGVFDSIYSCNGDNFFNAYCLIVKIPGFSIALHRGFLIIICLNLSIYRI